MIPGLGRRRKPPDLSLDELYRRYGMVMEQAQLLEQVVRGHAHQAEFVNLREMGSSPTVLPRMERIDGKTIGWVEQRYEMPAGAKELVSLARELRNDLAHNFFDSIDKHPTEGRLKAAGKLLAYSRVFHAASTAIAELHPEPDAPTPPPARPQAFHATVGGLHSSGSAAWPSPARRLRSLGRRMTRTGRGSAP